MIPGDLNYAYILILAYFAYGNIQTESVLVFILSSCVSTNSCSPQHQMVTRASKLCCVCVTRDRKREYHFHKNPRGLHHMTSMGLQSYSCRNVDMTYTSFLIFSLKDHSNLLPQNLAPLTHFVLVMTLISRLVMRIVPW